MCFFYYEDPECSIAIVAEKTIISILHEDGCEELFVYDYVNTYELDWWIISE